MKKLVSAKEIARRVSGVSAFGFGVQWQYSESDRETVRQFIAFLEDRRALYSPTQVEIEGDVLWSVNSIREQATITIGKLPEHSESVVPVRAIRAACRKYLESSKQTYPNIIALNQEAGYAAPWLVALGEFRSTIGIQIGILAANLDLNIEEELASILPDQDCDE